MGTAVSGCRGVVVAVEGVAICKQRVALRAPLKSRTTTTTGGAARRRRRRAPTRTFMPRPHSSPFHSPSLRPSLSRRVLTLSRKPHLGPGRLFGGLFGARARVQTTIFVPASPPARFWCGCATRARAHETGVVARAPPTRGRAIVLVARRRSRPEQAVRRLTPVPFARARPRSLALSRVACLSPQKPPTMPAAHSVASCRVAR